MICLQKKFKKITAGILAFLMLLSLVPLCSLPTLAAGETANAKTVRVAVDESNPFFTFDASGIPVSGYGYEYIQAIVTYANWKVEYVSGGSFSSCLQMVEEGNADLYYDVSYTEERASRFLYPTEPMGTEEYYLFCAADNKDIRSNDYASFDGKSVGIISGTVGTDELKNWCAKKDIALNFAEFQTNSEMSDALKSGKIDLGYDINLLANGNLSALEKIFSSDYYLVANKDRADLISDIDHAYSTICAIDKFFLNHLNEKYFGKTVISKTLTVEETNWVSSHDTLKIGYPDNFLPFCGTDEFGNPVGIVKDLVPLMTESLGLSDSLTIKYVGFTDSTEMFDALNKGQIDVIFPAYDSIAFGTEKRVLLTSEVISLSADIAYNKNHATDMTATIAVNRNNYLQEYYVRTRYPDSEIVYFDSIDQCLSAVEAGTVKSTILNGLRTSGLISQSKYDHLDAFRLTETFSFSFAVRLGNSELFSLLNRAVAGIDSSAAFNFAFNYIGSSGSSSFLDYMNSHKLLLMSIALLVLVLVLFVVLVILIILGKAKKRLSEASKAKTTFLFNMSHDIRTPMNAIVGFTDMALKSIDNKEKLTDSLLKIKRANGILISLINSILEMSRIESGKAVLIEEPADVQYSFVNIQSTMTELARENDVEINFEIGDIMDRYVYMDYDRTTRIFINLITNAVKYTESGGHVRIRCEQFGRRADGYGLYRYTFEDNGIGMSEEFQKHIFDEFSRENNSTATGIEGTGLGLSVVKAFVSLMNGNIEFTSKQGEGTTFTVILPFKIQKDEENARYAASDNEVPVPAPSEEEGSTDVSFAGKKVLLVEDNELNREIATFILTEKEMIVEEAEDGTVAVERLQKNGPYYYDYILMDIQMPTMSGYEATQIIRKMYPDVKIPIIALSANAFAEDKSSSIAAGMNDHIAKPVNNAELFKVLAKYL